MKNATKPRKRKLLGFAEQLGSNAPSDPVDAGPLKSTVSPPPDVDAMGEAAGTLDVAPAVPSAQIKAEPVPAASTKGIAAYKPPAKPASAPPVKAAVAAPRPAVADKRQSKAPGGFFVIILVIVTLLFAGPPILMIVSALAYPFVILISALAIWKIYDLFHAAG